ncbi:hypothetical protein ON010_g18425 [Phytophthora cinnamomi]|nr:hypothetical protein ON010_g18425 [Phytophthora cinnamomi]
MATRWNVGRDKKCKHTGVDVFFMTLSTYIRDDDSALPAPTPVEEGMSDDGPLLERFPSSWVTLADKGYQRLADTCRVDHPSRRRPTVPQTVEKAATNRSIPSDRITASEGYARCGPFAATTLQRMSKRMDAKREANRRARERRLLRLATKVPPVDEEDSSGSYAMTKYSAEFTTPLLGQVETIGQEK